jgi:hypothetical protein
VTFEAWEAARAQPEALRAAFQEIIASMAEPREMPVYMITSRGLTTESADKGSELLRDIAASTEADVLAEQLLKRTRE